MDVMTLINALPGACAQGLIWGIMAIGLYITYKILDLADLTVDGTMATGGAVCVMMMLNGYSIGIALLCSFVAGVLAGMVTGFLHTALGIPAILAGILTQQGLYSINLWIMEDKANQAISVDKYDLLVSLRHVKGVPFYQNASFVTILFIIVIIAILYWFFGTELGCSIRSTGANPNMSRAQGINTNITKTLGLMISNGIIALASALFAQYQGFADVNSGRGAIVIGLASIIIGQVVFGKIRGNFAFKMLAAALGAIIYYLVLQVVTWMGLPTNFLKLFAAVIVAVFLAIPYLKRKYFTKPVKRGGVEHA